MEEAKRLVHLGKIIGDCFEDETLICVINFSNLNPRKPPRRSAWEKNLDFSVYQVVQFIGKVLMYPPLQWLQNSTPILALWPFSRRTCYLPNYSFTYFLKLRSASCQVSLAEPCFVRWREVQPRYTGQYQTSLICC